MLSARRWLIHVAVVLLAAAAALTVSASGAQAYNLIGCKYNASGNALKWKDNTSRYEYSNPAAFSIKAWNDASSQIQFTKVSSGANLVVTDGNFGTDAFYGVMLDASGVDPVADNPINTSCNSSGYWTATITTWWNRYVTDSLLGAEKQATMVHEIGHALGLDHRYTSGQPCSTITIMDYHSQFWNRCGRNTPALDDINGAQTLY